MSLYFIFVLCITTLTTAPSIAAPRVVYSMYISNDTPNMISCTVTYTAPDSSTTDGTMDIQAGQTVHFDEITSNQGTWVAVDIINSVACSSICGSDLLEGYASSPFDVSSPTRDYVLNVSAASDGSLKLSHPSS